MKILITTPGSRLGGILLPELLAPEFSVRIICRNPDRVPAGVRVQVEIIRGSIDDAQVFGQALEDVDALFWRVPRLADNETDLRGHCERFAHAAAMAIRYAETPRVVTISEVLSHRAGCQAIEDILNQSGAAIRHFRSGWLMEELLEQAGSIRHQGVYSYPIAWDIGIPMTTAHDLADVVLRHLVRQDWNGIKSVGVHSVEPFSFLKPTRPPDFRKSADIGLSLA